MSTVKKRVEKILAEHQTTAQLSSWELHTFLPSIAKFAVLSEKQEAVLAKIELRLELAKEKDVIHDSNNS